MTVLLFTVRVVAAMGLVVSLLAVASVAGLALACAGALLIAGSVVRWVLLLLIAEPDFIAPTPGLRVAVVTSYVPNAESLPMLERTLTAMDRLSYTHDTWLLDEGDDEAAIELCRRLGVKHFSRKYKPEYQTEQGPFQHGTKHGNYNAWLTETGFAGYDFLAAIDPDHVPEKTFLTETLGQLSDPRVAYVQSPQEYYNQPASLIARGCSEESRDYYLDHPEGLPPLPLPFRHRLPWRTQTGSLEGGGWAGATHRRRSASHTAVSNVRLARRVRAKGSCQGSCASGLGDVPEAAEEVGQFPI